MSPLPPGASPAGAPRPAPVPLSPPPVGPSGIVEAFGVPAVAPWERRQPPVLRRSVVPVEWFRRIPGGGTTYAPVDDSDPESEAAETGQRSSTP